MRPQSLPAGILAALLLQGCGDTVVLSDADGWLELRYGCSSFQSAARSSAEHAVVREYASRIVYQAARANMLGSIAPIVEQYDSPDYTGLEQAVVEHLCSDGRLAGVAEVDSARQANRFGPASPERRTTAPDFIAPWLNREYLAGTPDHLQLANLRGNYVVLNFWATWCIPCIRKHPDLVALANRYADRSVTVVGILHRDRSGNALEWLEASPTGAYRSVVDETGRIGNLYGVWGLPRVFVIDPSGVVADNAFYLDADSLALRLDRLLDSSSR